MKNFLPIQRATAKAKYKKGYPIFILAGKTEIKDIYLPIINETKCILNYDRVKFYYKTHN